MKSIARRMAYRLGHRVSVDDLAGIGNLALLNVASSYDPSRAPFSKYASMRLKWAMLDGLRRETHGRIEAGRLLAVLGSERLSDAERSDDETPTTHEQDELALGGLLDRHAAALAIGLLASPHDGGDSTQVVATPEEQVSRAEALAVAQRLIQSLPGHQRVLLERHYFGGETFDAIARDLGITTSWASRLHERAILALSRAMGGTRHADARANGDLEP